jgi:rare lipoprotein A
LVIGLLGLAACATRAPERAAPAPPPSVPAAPAAEQPTFTQTGLASWYGAAHQGQLTADGEHFDRAAFTAAHPNLAIGTIVRVTNLTTGKSIKVRINDRGPRARHRVIDLSQAAAHALALQGDGVARVSLEVYASDQ